MGEWIDFYLHRSPLLFGSPSDYRDARFACYGFPFDSTTWFRPGSRFGPLAIRIVSQGLENPYGFVSLSDLGDLPSSLDVRTSLKRIFRVVKEIVREGKIPVGIGGEHTMSLAAVKASCKDKYGLIVFDAHLDLKDEFMDSRINHATWLRRLIEKGFRNRVLVIGARGFESDELEYAEQEGVSIIMCKDTMRSKNEIKSFLERFDKIYLSIDVDVLDPSYASGVSSPEPLGMTPNILHESLEMILENSSMVGVDVVEVNPLFDRGEAALQAASILLKIFATTASQV